MRILLDTHIFLWYISGDSSLPVTMLSILRSSRNDLYLSVASVWEATVKYQQGKLSLPQIPSLYISSMRQQHNILSLSLDEASVGRLLSLPNHHRDPFDRMLICQAIEYGMQLATVDPLIRAYPVQVV